MKKFLFVLLLLPVLALAAPGLTVPAECQVPTAITPVEDVSNFAIKSTTGWIALQTILYVTHTTLSDVRLVWLNGGMVNSTTIADFSTEAAAEACLDALVKILPTS